MLLHVSELSVRRNVHLAVFGPPWRLDDAAGVEGAVLFHHVEVQQRDRLDLGRRVQQVPLLVISQN